MTTHRRTIEIGSISVNKAMHRTGDKVNDCPWLNLLPMKDWEAAWTKWIAAWNEGVFRFGRILATEQTFGNRLQLRSLKRVGFHEEDVHCKTDSAGEDTANDNGAQDDSPSICR